MAKKIGFIGCGNMGTAMIAGMLESGKVEKINMIASSPVGSDRTRMEEIYGITATADNKEVATFADIIFLAVKPQYYEEVLTEIKESLTEEKILVSITPGKTLAWLEEMAGKPRKVIRTMPNTPA
ncbi:MAG: NAD(P)-binding domain-containing protein, partial [Lachnospiraceae bacterium]|nr:NAD(P)-binding domain-containing protein [Lachnospiraceae bacterium]